MEEMPLVSVVLPVYNGEEYLAQSIESCLNQTYRNIELIVVNDCSTDATATIVEGFIAKDNRVRLINNATNKKLPASLNVGHAAAKGDYITWTSDDNYYDLSAVEIMVSTLKNKKVDIVYANYNQISGNKNKVIKLLDFYNLIRLNCIGACFLYNAKVYKNSKYDEHLFLVEDYDFWLQNLKKYNYYHINQTLYHYRVHEASLTSSIEKDSERNSLFVTNIEKSYNKFFSSFNVDAVYAAKVFTKLHTAPYSIQTAKEILDINKIINTCSKALGLSEVNKNNLMKPIATLQLQLLRAINKEVNYSSCLIFFKMNYKQLNFSDFKVWIKLCLRLQ